MPLSDEHKHLLHEIYGVPYAPTTVSTDAGGLSMLAFHGDTRETLKERLNKAIVEIDADETKARRVGTILTEYVEISIDRSPVSTGEYMMMPERNIRAMRDALFVYTGIHYSHKRSNRMCLG